MTTIYQALEKDNYRPKDSKEVLARFDNYQIYSLVWVDYKYSRTIFRRSRISVSSDNSNSFNSSYFTYTIYKDFESVNTAENYTYNTKDTASKAIAFQRYSVNKIPINFFEIAKF